MSDPPAEGDMVDSPREVFQASGIGRWGMNSGIGSRATVLVLNGICFGGPARAAVTAADPRSG